MRASFLYYVLMKCLFISIKTATTGFHSFVRILNISKAI